MAPLWRLSYNDEIYTMHSMIKKTWQHVSQIAAVTANRKMSH
jgi:hypothetical protein